MTAPSAVSVGAQASPSGPNNEPVVAKRRKRGEYNTLACQSCRRKKVKCPGGQPCAECQKSGEVCVSPEGHRKQRKLNATQSKLSDIRTALATAGCFDEGIVDAPADISECVRAVTARLSHLEAELAMGDAGVTRPSTERRGGEAAETVSGATAREGSLSHARVVSDGNHLTVPAPCRRMDAHDGPPSGNGLLLPLPSERSQVSDSLGTVGDASMQDFAVPSAGEMRPACPSTWHSLSDHGPKEHDGTEFGQAGSVLASTHDSSNRLVPYQAQRPEEVSPRSSSVIEGGEKRDSSSLALLIEDLGRTVGHDLQSLPPPESEPSLSDRSPLAYAASRTGNTFVDDLAQARRAVQDCNGIRFRASFDIFFQSINPHHPVLNELAVRQGFDRYLWDAIDHRSQPEDPEFLALLLLIHAETQLLAYNRRVSDPIPGRQEYEIGDSILAHTMQSTRSSCVTIQCLILKSRYLLYLERLDSAYDTMGRAVRLCFQLKLHVRSTLSTVNDVEAVMRKRIFWCVVQLDGAISSTCGLPHQIRSSDFNLDMPAILDDRVLMVGRPLPMETPLTSSIPYLNEFIKSSSLHSEVWNNLFGVNAENPLSQSALEALEARIVALHHSLPDSLRWRSLNNLAPEMAYYAPFICRQSLSLHLRSINMRLLLYQSQLMSLTFDEAAAAHCLQLAAKSIDSIAEYYATSFQSADRYFCTMFLTAVIMPLSCIILKGGYAGNIQNPALDAFTAAMRLMDGMAPSFDPTRRMLFRFSGIRDAIGKIGRARSTRLALGHELFDEGDPIPTLLDTAVEQAESIPLVSVQEMSDLFSTTNGKPSAVSGWCDRMWDDLSIFGVGNSDSFLAPILSPMPL